MAPNKMFIMLPVMFAVRKLDGDDPNIVFMLRCSYITVQTIIVLSSIYIYLAAQKLSKSKMKDLVLYITPPPQPLADPNAKVQMKQVKFGEHVTGTARSLISSTIFGIILTFGLHMYKGMIVGLAMQSIMGPFNLFENPLAKAILLNSGSKAKSEKEIKEKFGGKTREDLDPTDEIVDAEGKVTVVKNLPAPIKKEKTFEDLLLDTWDDAASADIAPLVKALSKKNVNFKTAESRWTPVMIMAAIAAKESGDALKKMKNMGGNAGIVDGDGWNALHWAAFHGSLEGAKVLIESYGAIKAGLHSVKDNDGKTALDIAKEEKNNDVAAALEKAIADSETEKKDT